MKRSTIAAGAATILTAAALIGTGLAGATHATAATTSTTNAYVSYPTGVHNAPDSQAPVIKVLSAGTPVTALCVKTDGSDEGGNSTWFRISTGQPGGGWVPRAVLGGVPDLKACAPTDR